MKVWKDTHYFRIFLLSLGYIFVIFMIWISFNNLELNIKRVSINLIILLIPIIIITNIHRNRLSFITNEGIFMGNTILDNYEKIILPKNAFLSWKEIDTIKISNHTVNHNTRLVLRPFLNIKSKDGKKYECFIAQPESFVQALKKLNRFNLMSKDSKYLDVSKK